MNWDLNTDTLANGKTLPVSGNDFPGLLASDWKMKANQGWID
jgi:hypothetical protein